MPVDTRIESLENQLKESDNQMEIIFANSDKMNKKLEAVTSTCASLGNGYHSSFNYNGCLPAPKLDFPSFNGTNVRVWLQRVHRYFQINPIADSRKVLFASLSFQDHATRWFLEGGDVLRCTPWREFVLAIHDRFAVEYITGEFHKPQQESTPDEYQVQSPKIVTNAAVETLTASINARTPVTASVSSSSAGKQSIASAGGSSIDKELAIDIVCSPGNGSLAVHNTEETIPLSIPDVVTYSQWAQPVSPLHSKLTETPGILVVTNISDIDFSRAFSHNVDDFQYFVYITDVWPKQNVGVEIQGIGGLWHAQFSYKLPNRSWYGGKYVVLSIPWQWVKYAMGEQVMIRDKGGISTRLSFLNTDAYNIYLRNLLVVYGKFAYKSSSPSSCVVPPSLGFDIMWWLATGLVYMVESKFDVKGGTSPSALWIPTLFMSTADDRGGTTVLTMGLVHIEALIFRSSSHSLGSLVLSTVLSCNVLASFRKHLSISLYESKFDVTGGTSPSALWIPALFLSTEDDRGGTAVLTMGLVHIEALIFRSSSHSLRSLVPSVVLFCNVLASFRKHLSISFCQQSYCCIVIASLTPSVAAHFFLEKPYGIQSGSFIQACCTLTDSYGIQRIPTLKLPAVRVPFMQFFNIAKILQLQITSLRRLTSLAAERNTNVKCMVFIDSAELRERPTILLVAMSTGERVYANLITTSYLRMFTKSPTHFNAAWSPITRGYEAYFRRQYSFTGNSPDTYIIKSVHRQFSLDELLQMTLSRSLYMETSTNTHESIRTFLYYIHLIYTRMPLFPLFYILCTALHCNSYRCLLSPEYTRQLVALQKLLEPLKDDKADHKLPLWKLEAMKALEDCVYNMRNTITEGRTTVQLPTSYTKKIVDYIAEALAMEVLRSITADSPTRKWLQHSRELRDYISSTSVRWLYSLFCAMMFIPKRPLLFNLAGMFGLELILLWIIDGIFHSFCFDPGISLFSTRLLANSESFRRNNIGLISPDGNFTATTIARGIQLVFRRLLHYFWYPASRYMLKVRPACIMPFLIRSNG